MKMLLRTLVAQFLDSADDSSHAFRRLYNIGVRGCREFNLDVLGTLKTVVLDVEPNNTAYLPTDYLTYSKIGVLNHKGEVVTYKRNDQLSQWNDIYTQQAGERQTGAPLAGYGIDPTTYPNYYNYWFNGQMGQLFGMDSGTAKVGEYKLDEGNGLILLAPHNHFDQVVLEYLADGYDATADDYEIDTRAEEAFICYLRWKNAQDLRKKYSQSDVRTFKIEFYREKRLAAMRINAFVLNEMQDVAHSQNKLAPRA